MNIRPYRSKFAVAIVATILAATVHPAWAAETSAPATAAGAPAGAPLPKFTGPYLLTDVGQGNGAKVVRALLKKNKDLSSMEMKELAKPDDLAGIKTLIVAVGSSTKGLGAAGLDADKEMGRAKELLDAAKTKGISVVGIHLGGQARRGDTSDPFNKFVVERSQLALVWKEGDEDGFFTKLATENKIPLKVVAQKNEAADVLKDALAPAPAAAAKAGE